MKYKAGDKVTLKNKRGCHWNVHGLMDKYMGQTVTIKNVFDQIAFEIEEDDSWTFMFDDICGEIDWSTMPVDTRILVSNEGECWDKRYFAKFEDGKVYAFANGLTEWTSEGWTNKWNYAKLAEEAQND